MAFILQHQQQAVATSASHQLELSAMQMYLERELARQDSRMDSMRSVCRRDMEVIVADMKKVSMSTIQFSPLTHWVVVIQQRSSSSLFCRRPS